MGFHPDAIFRPDSHPVIIFLPAKSKLHCEITSRDACRQDDISRQEDIIVTRRDEISRRGGISSVTPDFCYRIVVFKRTGVFIIVSVPICMYKNVTKYLKIICRADFFIFTHFLMGRWWLLCTTLCSSKLRFGYQ